MTANKIEIYTDGSCLGNPGPGGYGALILIDGKMQQVSGGEKDTTNNRMEMTAIVKALEWLHQNLPEADLHPRKIVLHSDSNLIIQTLNQGWKRKANTDLWAEMDRLRAWLDIDWVWVKAHADNELNNRVDELAFSEAKKQEK